jgi:hypothetical protein
MTLREFQQRAAKASRSPKGLEFWQKSCTYAPDNQKELF